MPKLPRLIIALFLLLGSAGVGTSCGKTKSGPATSLDPQTVEAINEAVASVMEKYHAPGALVGIWTGEGASFVRAYGSASLEPQAPMHKGLSFRIGSVTKTFTATLVLILADQGLISLDDPVSEYVSDVPQGDRINLRMLLNHTSGLFNYGNDETLNEILAADPQREWKPEELVAAAASNPPYFPPGEGTMYSNTNYVLLGMVVEKATGNSLEEELERRVTGPLGLRDTYMAKGPQLEGEYAHGFMFDPESGELTDLSDYLDASVVWSAGGMVSTLEDLRVWGRALGEGTLLSPETYREATGVMREIPNSAEYFGHPLLYGMGVMDLGGWLGHDGMQPGYNTAVFYLPDRETTVVVFLNVSDVEEPAVRLFMKLAEILYPDLTPWGTGSDAGSR